MSDVERLGSDRLCREGERLIVDAAAEMDGWDVRRFRKTCIRFDDAAYEVVRRMPAPGGGVRYILEPWSQDLQDGPALEIDYDLGYVDARDRALRALMRRRTQGAFLLPAYPLLGLLPSRWKAVLQERYGVHPRTMTAWSIWLEYACITLDAVFLALHASTGIFNGSYLVAVLVVLIPDALVRYTSLLEEQAYPPGFYEWTLRFRLW